MFTQDWNADRPVRSGGPLSLSPWVKRLLVANATVYLLTITVFTGRWVLEDFGFDPRYAWEQPWTFVTYLFVHGGPIHLAVNSLMLFIFGPAVEERMGSPAFARYYLFCGLGGAFLSLALWSIWPTMGPIIGASGAIFGVSLAFALYWPNEPIFIFPFPVPIKAKWLIIGLATFDLWMQIMPGRDGVARLAHLGGLLFGFLYLKGLPYIAARTAAAAEKKKEAVRVLVHPSASSEHEDRRLITPPAQSRSPSADDVDDVDRVLEKISRSGMASLTPEERRILDERSRELRSD